MVFVVEISLAGVLELHLNKVRPLIVAGHVCQIVVGVERSIGTSASAGTEAAKAGSSLEFFVHRYIGRWGGGPCIWTRERGGYPTLPSREMLRSFWASTANSIGNLLMTSRA